MKHKFFGSAAISRFIGLFISAALFSACGPSGSVDTIASNMVNNSQIFQNYYVEGNKSDERINAIFRVGGSTGTTVDLTEPAKISCNGINMEKSGPGSAGGTGLFKKGTDYNLHGEKYETKHDFSFSDSEGKTYLNSISLAPLEAASNAPIRLNLDKPTLVPLSRAVAPDEKLLMTLELSVSDEVSPTESSIYLDQTRRTLIITPRYWTAKSLDSTVSLKMRISKTAAVSQGTQIGGTISADYDSAPVSVSISRAKTANTNVNAAVNTVANSKKPVNVNANTAAVANAAKPANTMAGAQTTPPPSANSTAETNADTAPPSNNLKRKTEDK